MEYLTNSLKTIFNIDNNTSATLIVALTVFILGFLFTGLSKSIVAYRYRRNYRKIFKEMINEIILCTKKQSNNLKNLVDTLSIENKNYFKLKKQNINLLNNFSQIPFDTFYSAYFKGFENLCKRKKLTAFNKTFGLTDSLLKNENQIITELNNCINSFNKHADKWNDSSEKVRLNIENIRLALDGKSVLRNIGDFFQAIDQTVYDWEKLNNRSQYFIAYSQLIKPMLDLYAKNENNDVVRISKMLLDSLMDSEYHYLTMKRTLGFYRELFTKFEYQYKYTSRLLNKINLILN